MSDEKAGYKGESRTDAGYILAPYVPNYTVPDELREALQPVSEYKFEIVRHEPRPPASICPKCRRTARTKVVFRGEESCELCELDAITEAQRKLTVVEETTVPFVLGERTLVGGLVRVRLSDGSILPVEYPLKSGNCFSISGVGPVRNMNCENAEEIIRRVPALRDGVAIHRLSNGSIRIVDERVPVEWRRHQCTVHKYNEE